MNRVRVGIAGFGTVGRATAEIISAHADLIAQTVAAADGPARPAGSGEFRAQAIPGGALYVPERPPP